MRRVTVNNVFRIDNDHGISHTSLRVQLRSAHCAIINSDSTFGRLVAPAGVCAGRKWCKIFLCLVVCLSGLLTYCWACPQNPVYLIERRMMRVATTVARRSWTAVRTPARSVVGTRTFATEATEEAGFGADEISLNLALPQGPLVNNVACKRVTVPGRGGTYGIQRNSPPMLSELKPGIVLVDYGREDMDRFFISGGFAFTHDNGTVEVSAPEGVRIEDIDPDLVRQKAEELRVAADNAAEGSVEEAEAHLGLEVYRAIGYELDIKV